MHFKQLASRWEESETCLLPYRALNTICSFWSCCEGWLGHKAEGIWNFRVPGIKAFSLTPRLHDKKSCVKKPRASHPDFLTLFIKKLKGLACQTTLIVLYTTSEAACKQAHAHRTLFLQVLLSLSLCTFKSKTAGWPGIHAGRCGHFIPHSCLPSRPHNLHVRANCKKSDLPHLL